MKLFRIFYLVFTCFLCQTLLGTIFQATKFSRQLPNGSQQTVILLGDCHEYSYELAPSNREHVEAVTTQQRDEIIKLAQELNATVLIEDLANHVASYPIFGLPTMITLALDKLFDNYHYQVITNFTPYCHAHGVKAHSIECRHAASILRAPPTYLPPVMNVLTCLVPKVLATVISDVVFGPSIAAHFVFNIIKTVYANVQELTTYQKILLQTNQGLENKHVLQTAQELHQQPEIKSILGKIERYCSKKPYAPIDQLVDFKTLNFIVQHPQEKNIIVCAGAWHTDNLAYLLEQYDYQEYTLDYNFSCKDPLVINTHDKALLPLAITQTVLKKSVSLA